VLLRRWREVRNKSQIALSLDAGVSQRHLSFIEIGRSSPSLATLLVIADALDVPFRDCRTPVSRDSCIALTSSENGLVMSHPPSFCRPAGVRLHFGL
jgi:transcriptional regulator with XRE-family HTH domain